MISEPQGFAVDVWRTIISRTERRATTYTSRAHSHFFRTKTQVMTMYTCWYNDSASAGRLSVMKN